MHYYNRIPIYSYLEKIEKIYSWNSLKDQRRGKILYKFIEWFLWTKLWINTIFSILKNQGNLQNDPEINNGINFFTLLPKAEVIKLNNITISKSDRNYNFNKLDYNKKDNLKVIMNKKDVELKHLYSILDNFSSAMKEGMTETSHSDNKNKQESVVEGFNRMSYSLDLCTFDRYSHNFTMNTTRMDSIICNCYLTKSGEVVLTIIESKLINFFYFLDTFTIHFVLCRKVLGLKFLSNDNCPRITFPRGLVTRVDLMELTFGIDEFLYEYEIFMDLFNHIISILLDPVELFNYDIGMSSFADLICEYPLFVKMGESENKNLRIPTYMDLRINQIHTAIPESDANNLRIPIEDNFVPIPESAPRSQLPDYDDPGVSNINVPIEESYDRTNIIPLFDTVLSYEEVVYVYGELCEEVQVDYYEDLGLDNGSDTEPTLCLQISNYDDSNFNVPIEESYDRTNMIPLFDTVISYEEVVYVYGELCEEVQVDYYEDLGLGNGSDTEPTFCLQISNYDDSNFNVPIEESYDRTNMIPLFDTVVSYEEVVYVFEERCEEVQVDYNEDLGLGNGSDTEPTLCLQRGDEERQDDEVITLNDCLDIEINNDISHNSIDETH